MKPMKTCGYGFALAALMLTITGCKTYPHEYSRSHFWIYVPIPSLDVAKGYPAEVALPNVPLTTNRIKVRVLGEVVSPELISVPKGCTVLQAIGHAGGFTAAAGVNRLRLTRSSGQRYDLRLRSKPIGWSVVRRVYYEIETRGTNAANRNTWSPQKTDYVLENGDRIYVGRVTL